MKRAHFWFLVGGSLAAVVNALNGTSWSVIGIPAGIPSVVMSVFAAVVTAYVAWRIRKELNDS